MANGFKNKIIIFLGLIFIFPVFFSLNGEDIWIDHNPYHPLASIPEGSIIKIFVDEPVVVEYEYEGNSGENVTIKMTPDKDLMNFLPKANVEKSITSENKVRIRARGRVRFRAAVTVVGNVENGVIRFQGRKTVGSEEGRAEQVITISGRVSVDDVTSSRTIKSSDVADLVVQVKGLPVAKKKNIEMKTEQPEDPNEPAKKSAKISDDEKQQLLLEYLNRILGESGME
ncbi:MAG: flagellar basal body L-ring protein FlgH [Spirochaetia bacterium]|nr:flagellar basal body L-ring protein FlgH [Spirochaetia bacterium]